jgi:hypothetical protein
MKVLAKDSYWYTRYSLAMSHNTPKEILQVLSKDAEYDVRAMALDRLRGFRHDTQR